MVTRFFILPITANDLRLLYHTIGFLYQILSITIFSYPNSWERASAIKGWLWEVLNCCQIRKTIQFQTFRTYLSLCTNTSFTGEKQLYKEQGHVTYNLPQNHQVKQRILRIQISRSRYISELECLYCRIVFLIFLIYFRPLN